MRACFGALWGVFVTFTLKEIFFMHSLRIDQDKIKT